MTKSLKEFLEQKYFRGDATQRPRDIDVSYYFRINKKTPEKLQYINDWISKSEV